MKADAGSPMTPFGYAGRILKVDVSDGSTSIYPTAAYADRFIGGRGLALKLFWDMVPAAARAFDPENCLICVTGPVAGFPGFAGYRWQICAKSPAGMVETFSFGNLGGKWGANLKFAGYDALVITGRAEHPVYLAITASGVSIKPASDLWGLSTFDTAERLKTEYGKSFSVLSIGPAAEQRVAFATLLTDDGASGSGGLGGVMGSKLVKAVVVGGDSKPTAADPQGLRALSTRIRSMRKERFVTAAPWKVPGTTQADVCFGCGLGCSRQVYKDDSGRRMKSFCQAACVYYGPAMPYYKGRWHADLLAATRLCDAYGLDTIVMQSVIEWLAACRQEGLLGEAAGDLLPAEVGSPEFIQQLVETITRRKGFGELLAQGPVAAAQALGGRAEELIYEFVATPAGEKKDYDPRLMPVTALLFATEPRRPIQQLHEPCYPLKLWLSWVQGEPNGFFTSEDFRLAAVRFWGSEAAADYTSMQGKALAAKKIQDRTYAKESLILCDFNWPMIWTDYPGGHVGDPTLESQVFSAVTGRQTDEAGLNVGGERIFNLQRAVLLRHGRKGRPDDRLMDHLHQSPLKKGEVFFDPQCLVPGPDGLAASNEGRVVDRNEFEQSKSEYYRLRGWDETTGLPTVAKLKALGLDDLIDNPVDDPAIRG